MLHSLQRNVIMFFFQWRREREMEEIHEHWVTKYVGDMSSPVWQVWTTHTGDGRLHYERAGMLNLIASGSFRFRIQEVFRVYQSTWGDEGQRTRRSWRGCCRAAGQKGTATWPWGDSGHKGADRDRRGKWQDWWVLTDQVTGGRLSSQVTEGSRLR